MKSSWFFQWWQFIITPRMQCLNSQTEKATNADAQSFYCKAQRGSIRENAKKKKKENTWTTLWNYKIQAFFILSWVCCWTRHCAQDQIFLHWTKYFLVEQKRPAFIFFFGNNKITDKYTKQTQPQKSLPLFCSRLVCHLATPLPPKHPHHHPTHTHPLIVGIILDDIMLQLTRPKLTNFGAVDCFQGDDITHSRWAPPRIVSLSHTPQLYRQWLCVYGSTVCVSECQYVFVHVSVTI